MDQPIISIHSRIRQRSIRYDEYKVCFRLCLYKVFLNWDVRNVFRSVFCECFCVAVFCNSKLPVVCEESLSAVTSFKKQLIDIKCVRENSLLIYIPHRKRNGSHAKLMNYMDLQIKCRFTMLQYFWKKKSMQFLKKMYKIWPIPPIQVVSLKVDE